jgi:predicted amino acid dehydrogenase
MVEYKFTKALYPFALHLALVGSVALSSDLDTMSFLGLWWTTITLGLILYKILRTVYDSWFGVLLGHNVNLRRMGKWAVVTGATDGIGLAYSRQLAKRGMSIVLMSRSMERLERTARELQLRYGVDTKVIAVDFSQGKEEEGE